MAFWLIFDGVCLIFFGVWLIFYAVWLIFYAVWLIFFGVGLIFDGVRLIFDGVLVLFFLCRCGFLLVSTRTGYYPPVFFVMEAQVLKQLMLC